jgi:5'-nucleotidase
MVTNDDGIDAPGLRALVQVLVSTRRFQVLVCAPDSCVLYLRNYISSFLNCKVWEAILLFGERNRFLHELIVNLELIFLLHLFEGRNQL